MSATDLKTSAVWRRGCAAVIVHYGPLGPTRDILHQLNSLHIKAVVVANDMCVDPEWVDLNYHWFTPARNLGYGEGFNFAVCSVPEYDCYLLLNNDVKLTSQALDGCHRVLSSGSKVGAVGPHLSAKDGQTQHGPGVWSRWLKRPISTRASPGKQVESEWLTGAVLLIKGEVARQIPFDGSYFLGWEDADWSIRVRSAGWSCVFAGDVSVSHTGGAVIGAWWYYYTARNDVWFARRNRPSWVAYLVWARSASRLPRILLADLLKRRGIGRTRWSISGLKDALRPLPDPREGPWFTEPVPLRSPR